MSHPKIFSYSSRPARVRSDAAEGSWVFSPSHRTTTTVLASSLVVGWDTHPTKHTGGGLSKDSTLALECGTYPLEILPIPTYYQRWVVRTSECTRWWFSPSASSNRTRWREAKKSRNCGSLLLLLRPCCISWNERGHEALLPTNERTKRSSVRCWR